MRRGVDFSHYGGGVTPDELDCWLFQGVQFAIVQYSESTRMHLAQLAGSPLEVDVYVYLYFPRSPWNQLPEERVRNAIAMCQGFHVRRIWLDVEDPGDSDTPAGTIAALQRCVAIIQAAGFEAGIYTAAWTWRSHTADSDAFAHLPLWHARYTSQSPVADLTREPTTMAAWAGGVTYGGWTQPLIWQWHNSTLFCGHSLDLNVMDGSGPPPAPPVPPISEEAPPLIRLNRFSAWYDDPAHQTFDGQQTRGVNARLDFADLPFEAVAVEADIFLYADSNDLGVFDGDESGAEPPLAFVVERPDVHYSGRVNLSPDGWFHLGRALGPGEARLRRVSITGYYLA